jgi:hypothetical protein
MPSNSKPKTKKTTSKTKARSSQKATSPKKKTAAVAREVRTSPRQLKIPHYSPFHIGKRIKPFRPRMTGAFRIFWRSTKLLFDHWKLFLGFSLIYGFFDLVLVHGLGSGVDLSNVRSSLLPLLGKHPNQVTTGLTLFQYLVSNSSNSSTSSTGGAAGVFEAVLVIIMSLVTIWSLRQIYSGVRVRIRQALYNGTSPLIAFLTVLLVIGVQLVPFLVGLALYVTVSNQGIAVHFGEKAIWLIVLIITTGLSTYWVCSSVFALYIVTLPDMTPIKALRSARGLVRYRRFIVLRKLLFLPLCLAIVLTIIMVPIIIVSASIAAWVFFVLSMFGLVIIHSYLYALYRELLA